MMCAIRIAATALLLGGVPIGAEGRVIVRFIDTAAFADAGVEYRSRPPSENPALNEIRQLLVSLGTSCVAADRSLEIVVRDVDLAGDEEWWHRRETAGLRVLREYANPKIQLEYVLRASDGSMLASGEDHLSTVRHLGRRAGLKTWDEPLHFEKLMLTQWFERRFCPAR